MLLIFNALRDFCTYKSYIYNLHFMFLYSTAPESLTNYCDTGPDFSFFIISDLLVRVIISERSIIWLTTRISNIIIKSPGNVVRKMKPTAKRDFITLSGILASLVFCQLHQMMPGGNRKDFWLSLEINISLSKEVGGLVTEHSEPEDFRIKSFNVWDCTNTQKKP